LFLALAQGVRGTGNQIEAHHEQEQAKDFLIDPGVEVWALHQGLQNRLLTTSFTVDSTKPVAIGFASTTSTASWPATKEATTATATSKTPITQSPYLSNAKKCVTTNFTPEASPLHLTRREDLLEIDLKPPDLSLYQERPPTDHRPN